MNVTANYAGFVYSVHAVLRMCACVCMNVLMCLAINNLNVLNLNHNTGISV